MFKENSKIDFVSFMSWLNEAKKCVKEDEMEDDKAQVSKSGKNKIVIHDGDEDGDRVTEETEPDDEEAERKAKLKAALAATDHVAKGGMQKKGYTGSTYNPQKKVQKEEIELAEAKIPVQHATDAVHKVLGQKSAVKFLTHLRPGTEKHTSWDKVNDALVKQGVKPQHIASIATHVKPAQYEEFELDEAIKLNSKVTIHDPGKSHHGKVGYVGEIRHGAYKGAPKTYTVDYDHNEETGRSKSIQLDKKNIKQVKEEVGLDEAEDWELKKIHSEYKHLKSLPTSDVLKKHKAQNRVSASYSSAEMGGKEGLISDIMRNRHGQKRMDAYHSLPKKHKDALSEEAELDEAMKPLPRRHFFQSYGVEGHGIAHDGKENHWKFENNKPVAHTKDPEVVAGWKRDLAAKSRTNEETELDEVSQELASKVFKKRQAQAVDKAKDGNFMSPEGKKATQTLNRIGNKFGVNAVDKLTNEEVDLDEEQKIKVSDIKAALKNVKNASDHTKKMIKANPTQKMPHDSSRHAAYSEEVELNESGQGFSGQSRAKVKEMGLSHAKEVHGSDVNEYGEDRYGETHFRNAKKEKVATLKRDGMGGYHMHVYHKPIKDLKEEAELDDIIESILGDKNDGAYKAGHQPKGRVVKGKSYGAEYNDDEDEKKAAPSGEKRGRGRPKKGADQSGEVKKYTFHDLLNKLSR